MVIKILVCTSNLYVFFGYLLYLYRGYLKSMPENTVPIKLEIHKDRISIAGSLFPLSDFQDFLLACYPHLAERFRSDFTTIRGAYTEIDGDSIRVVEVDEKKAKRGQYDWQGLLKHVSKNLFILYHFAT
jgi:hypothetical protein